MARTQARRNGSRQLTRPEQAKATRAVPATIGEYRIVREVGRGATATVYLAEHPRLEAPVACAITDGKGRATGVGHRSWAVTQDWLHTSKILMGTIGEVS